MKKKWRNCNLLGESTWRWKMQMPVHMDLGRKNNSNYMSQSTAVLSWEAMRLRNVLIQTWISLKLSRFYWNKVFRKLLHYFKIENELYLIPRSLNHLHFSQIFHLQQNLTESSHSRHSHYDCLHVTQFFIKASEIFWSLNKLLNKFQTLRWYLFYV